MAVHDLKKQILSQVGEAFEKAFSKKPESAGWRMELEFPPDVKLGDFTVACFTLAKELKISPAEAAKKISKSIIPNEVIESTSAVGPYVNIKVKNNALFEALLQESEVKKKKGERLMVEYLSPNTNKPLHLGHVRNGAIGTAIANLLSSYGHEVIKANMVNDRGVHICKSMLAYEKWGNGETPKSAEMKGDHLVGKYYVKYATEAEKNPELEKEVQVMLQKWEAGDKEVLKIWKTMNSWAYAGYEETYKKYGFRFDELFYESETYKLGKNIIENGLKKGVFKKDETGAVIFDLSEDEFGLDKDGSRKKITLLRADGTSVYLTQDLGTAAARAEKYNLDKTIYITGNEQIFHFKVLFKILTLLEYDWAKNLYHLPYGLVYLPEGKMKSREGKVVDADDLLAEVASLAAVEIHKRNTDISSAEITKRAEIVALGAIKFQLLRVTPAQDIHFNPAESVAIEGFTGPYCQYAYARISGILRNAKEKEVDEFGADYSLLGNIEERSLAKFILAYPEELKIAAEELNPTRIVTAVYNLASAFNLFYEKHQVISEENKKLLAARLALVKNSGLVLKKGLGLLGIEVLERM